MYRLTNGLRMKIITKAEKRIHLKMYSRCKCADARFPRQRVDDEFRAVSQAERSLSVEQKSVNVQCTDLVRTDVRLGNDFLHTEIGAFLRKGRLAARVPHNRNRYVHENIPVYRPTFRS